MSLRYWRLRKNSTLLSRIFSGTHLPQSRALTNLFSASSSIPVPYSSNDRASNMGGIYSLKYSTVSQLSKESTLVSVNYIPSFIESKFDELQGPNHCWLNKVEGDKDNFNKDGTFLVLAGQFLENPQIVSMIEKLKSLHQKFPQLCIMGFHCGASVGSVVDQAKLGSLVMKEYITFPILLSNKKILEMENGACYILFRDLRNPIFYQEEDLDFEMIKKEIEEHKVQENGNLYFLNLRSTWAKQADVVREPDLTSSLQNLLLYFPGCVSADESGDLLFLSDSNHHRIIILDKNGKIMDCIGSCPGFEDGEFESAKLLRPAASFYHDAEDCLYIVDSENHAIRRADMERRVLETLYPTCSISKKDSSLWTWIVNKMGFSSNIDSKSEELDSSLLIFPWHLLKSTDDSFFIINRSFDTLWIMDLASGTIKESVDGFPKILETCGQLIMEKVSLLKRLPRDWLQVQIDTNCSPKDFPLASLVSSLTTFENYVFVCDSVAQKVLKLHIESGVCSDIQFSNFGILGFPYWPSFPLERVYPEYSPSGIWTDHLHCLRLLPGRINIQLNLDIPEDVELVEPLEEGCIWRQTRGTATEVFGREDAVGSSDKVSIAQQWYDDMDNLVFSTPEPDVSVEDSSTALDVQPEDGKVQIDCAVNTSPGTSELVVYAALYLKLKRHPDIQDISQEQCAARIADILNPGRREGIGRDSCIQLFLKSNSDLRDLVFMKPLHVRIRFDSLDHPKAENGRDIILTDSSIKIDVKLQT